MELKKKILSSKKTKKNNLSESCEMKQSSTNLPFERTKKMTSSSSSPCSWLIYGANGWIGNMFTSFLSTKERSWTSGRARAENYQDVVDEIDRVQPDIVFSCLGRTHGPGSNTIDYLEQKGKLRDNIQDNLVAPLTLAQACLSRHVYMVYLGTGCIFSGSPDVRIKEEMLPNFFGSSYSIVKGATDGLISRMPNVLNLRIRMPIVGEDHPRNFVTKICNYDKVVNIQNSMSVLPTLFPCLVSMAERNILGTVNFTNPGSISHNEILDLYIQHVDPAFTYKNFSVEEQNRILKAERSNNVLDTSVLQRLCPTIPTIREAVLNCMVSYKISVKKKIQTRLKKSITGEEISSLTIAKIERDAIEIEKKLKIKLQQEQTQQLLTAKEIMIRKEKMEKRKAKQALLVLLQKKQEDKKRKILAADPIAQKTGPKKIITAICAQIPLPGDTHEKKVKKSPRKKMRVRSSSLTLLQPLKSSLFAVKKKKTELPKSASHKDTRTTSLKEKKAAEKNKNEPTQKELDLSLKTDHFSKKITRKVTIATLQLQDFSSDDSDSDFSIEGWACDDDVPNTEKSSLKTKNVGVKEKPTGQKNDNQEEKHKKYKIEEPEEKKMDQSLLISSDHEKEDDSTDQDEHCELHEHDIPLLHSPLPSDSRPCILITGGLGFIGSHFVIHVYKKYPNMRVINVDSKTYAANERNIPRAISKDTDRYILYNVNVNDVSAMEGIHASHRIEQVVHFAAESHVDKSFKSSIVFTSTNTLGTHVLLQTNLQNPHLKRFIHISTDEVYGSTTGDVDETQSVNPSNPYAASKTAAELMVKSYIQCFKLPVMIIRMNNVIGAKQYPEKLLPKFSLQSVNNKPLTLHGDGKAKRSFMFVDDAIRAIDTVLLKGEPGETYNVGIESEMSVVEVARRIQYRCKRNNWSIPKITFIPDRTFQDLRYSIDSTKIKNLGWTPSVSIGEAVDRTISWNVNNPNYWSKEVLSKCL